MKTYKVSELHDEVTSTLKGAFGLPFCVEGEITSYRGANSSGHYYFNLKDDKSSLACVLFKGKSFSCSTLPEMGKKVKITGKIETYSNPSSPSKYQIIISDMEDVGLGELYKKYLKLMKDLGDEGLFNDEHKNTEFPEFPKQIGVITSETGAVIHDIIETVKMRYPLAEIVLYPTKVQGDDAARDILKGLKYMEEHRDIETIILGRGGGSFEDLFCYNDERIVRYIFSMKKQVISSVGHDKDRPLCDFVSDVRASTPTQAAMIATPYTIEDLNGFLASTEVSMIQNFENFINNKFQDLDYYLSTIGKSFKNFIENKKITLDAISKQIQLLSYSSVLQRGFSLTTNSKGDLIKAVAQVKAGEQIKTVLQKGEIISTVK